MTPELEAAVITNVSNGWRLSFAGDRTAILYGPERRADHWAHAILTLLTFGLWVIAWIPIALAASGHDVLTLTDDDGKVTWTITAK